MTAWQTGGLMRKDGSGSRKGVERPPTKRQEDFPYDLPLVYGTTSYGGQREAVGTPVDLTIASKGTRTQTVPGGGVRPSGSEWAVAPAGERIFGRGTSSNISSRMAVSEAWVSLSKLPVSAMQAAVPLDREILMALRQEFAAGCQEMERATSAFSDAEKLLLMFDLDPEHTANSLVGQGSFDTDSIYRQWRDDALTDGDEEIE